MEENTPKEKKLSLKDHIIRAINIEIVASGKSKGEIARKVNMSGSSLSMIIKGHRHNMTLETLEKICSALDIPASKLFGIKEYNSVVIDLTGSPQVIQAEDILAIKDSRNLYSIYYDHEEKQWIATSIMLTDNMHHIHAEARSIPLAIYKLEVGVRNFSKK